jgi:hypothetical protein
MSTRTLVLGLCLAIAGCVTSDDDDVTVSAASAFPNDGIAFQFFVGKGLTDAQAAGVVGNLDQESGMNPGAVQSGGPGRGIAQWSVGGRWDNLVAHANAVGASPWSLDLQLEYVWLELVSYPQFGLAELQASTTVEGATIVFQNKFERCGVCHQATRIAYAHAAYAAFAGQGAGAGAYAFEANTTELWTHEGPRGLGMMPGTSPAIAVVSGGSQVAFQANTGSLWVTGAHGTGDWGLGMAGGTSPSIAALAGGGYQVAFQANTGELWVAGSAGTGPTGLGMMHGTSPSITALPGGGYQLAFQANTTELWVYGSAGTGPTGLGMMPGTSPTITARGGSYDVMFQANTTELWRTGASGTGSLGLGMAGGTSPAN